MIPAELRALPSWVVWRVESRRNGKGELAPTKVPYQGPEGRKRAQSTNPDTWCPYRDALACLDAEGVGFVFSSEDPYVGVDMDNCVERNGALHPAAWQIVHALDGYVEFSPSGRGLHIIVRGRLNRGRHTLKTPWGSELAVYDRARFFTMSGDGRGEIREAQNELMELIAFYFPEPDDVAPPVRPQQPVCGDDAAVLDRIHADSRMALLWAGDTSMHAGDHSAADLALAAHLGYLCGHDAERVDALFRRSGLMRDKWDSPRGESTYGQITIARALSRDAR